MTKSSMSILLAAMMATSGLAFSQTSPAPVPDETKAGSKNLTEVPSTSGTGSATTRADVKSEINKDGIKSGSKNLTEVPSTSGTGSATTRADVKSQITKDSTKAGSKNLTEVESTAGKDGMKSPKKKVKRDAKTRAGMDKNMDMSKSKSMGTDTSPGAPVKSAP